MTDAIDFSTVVIHNSYDEVRHWPITSEIIALGLRPTSLHLEHTQQGRWPAVRFVDALQEATVWIFLFIGGQWFGAGVERIRPGQIDKPENAPSHVDDDWYYDPARWHEMTGHEPKPGELVGFMVAAGDTRGFGNIGVKERSAIVLVEFPTDAGRDYPPFASLVPTPPLPPVVVPPPPPPPSSVEDLLEAVANGIDVLQRATDAVLRLSDKIAEVQKAGLRVHL